ncbi:MAG: cyclase family protein [Desulfitobacterium hafniense]|nr:cyclase family protein [Desulfitobacterium hafniense]
MSFKATKVLDLSQPIFSNCPGWPDFPTLKVDVIKTQPHDGYNMEELRDFTLHSATHIDAPYHFFAEGKKVTEISLDAYQGSAVVINLFHKKANERISKEDLITYDDKIKEGDIVLLCTGWGLKRAMTKEYMYEWPDLDGSGAEYLVSKKVKGVGIDGLSIGGYGAEKALPAHKGLLGAGIWVCEDMYIPKEILEHERWYFTAFPLKFVGVSGSPVRAVAMQFG